MASKLLYLLCILAPITCLADELFMEFEEANLPKGITSNKSLISIDTRHRIRGNQALKWDWQSGGSLQINRPLTCKLSHIRHFKEFKKTCTFKFWIYSQKALSNSKLRIVFGDKKHDLCSFPFNLDFTGWRTAWVSYERDMGCNPNRKVTYIRFEAPPNAVSGTFWIDDIAPSLFIDIRHHAPDQQVPFVNALRQHPLHASPHEPNILLHQKDLPLLQGVLFNDNHLTAFRKIDSKLSEIYPPVNKGFNKLVAAFDTYDIVKDDDGTIRGDHLLHLSSKAHLAGFPKRYHADILTEANKHDFRSYTLLLLNIARAYHYSKNQSHGTEQADRLKEMFRLMCEHLLDQGWQAGSAQGSIHHFSYASRSWAAAIFLMRDALTEADLLESMVDSLFWFFNVNKHFQLYSSSSSNMDYLNNTAFSELLAISILPDSKEKVLYFNAFRDSFGKILSLTTLGNQGGIKTDGSLFHHQMHYAGYGIPGIRGATRVISILDDTCFELSSDAYNLVKKAYLTALLWGYPFAGFNACGRHPLLYGSKSMAASMLMLAKAAPGTKTYDPELAAAYLGMENGDAMELFGNRVEPHVPIGAWSMNYNSSGIYKFRNTTVLLKGYGEGVRSHETYRTDNRYGSYSSHGTIQIIENTRSHKSGFEHNGWGWSQPPGATTLILPLDKLEANKGFYGRRIPQSAPFGGSAHLDNQIGLFAFRLDEDPTRISHSEALTVRKSVLYVDGKLICLGSGLSSESDYPLATTIFQSGLDDGHDTVQISSMETPVGTPFSKIWDSGATIAPDWIIDPYGTGHWVAPGSLVKLKVGLQESRHNKSTETTEGEFALAWIDHGKNIQDGSYTYVSLLEADVNQMVHFSQQMTTTAPFFLLKRRDNRTHAVFIPEQRLWALVNFESLHTPVGPFLSASQPSLVIMKQLPNSALRISVTDPRLMLGKLTTAPPVDVMLEIKGRYKLAGEPVPGFSVKVDGNKTILVIRCEGGEPTAFTLHIR